MRKTVIVRNGLLSALFWLALSLPALAQGVGGIGGIVTDESGGLLPGVTVTLSSPGVIGGNQTTVTDAQGAYQFTRLVAGRYSVKAELQGFRTVIQANVDVNADRTSRVDLRLAVGSLVETVTVVGGAPLLDTTSALNQTVVTRAALDTLPIGNDLWSIARLVPALQTGKYDVGGRLMFAASDIAVHGSRYGESSYLMDGMDLNSQAGGGASFYVDPFSLQEITFETGNVPAERESGGGAVVNVITKTGTNAFRGNAMFSGTTRALESDNVSGDLRTVLLAGVPAAALAANPNIKPGAALEHLFDTAVSWSGPIVRDRLWFVASGKLSEVYQYQVGSYNADGTQLLSDNRMKNVLGKVSWGVTPNNQVHYTYTWMEKARYHVAGGTRVTAFFDTRASNSNISPNDFHLARWTSVLSPRMVVDVAGSTTVMAVPNLPQKEVQHGDIPSFDSVTRVNTVAAGSYSQFNARRTNIASSLNYVAGTHDVKVGYQLLEVRRTTTAFAVSHFPSGLRAVYRNGVPDSVNTFNTPSSSAANSRHHAVYVQDRWRPVRKLTVNLGLRFQTTFGWLNDGRSPICQEATVFIEAKCFPAQKGIPDWKSANPRLSAIYDLFGDGRTALKFSVSRDRTSFYERDLTNPIRITNDTRSWRDLNGDGIPQLNELGPSTGFNLGTTNRYADGVRWPYSQAVSAELQQQLGGDMVVSAGYYYTIHRDQIGPTNVAVPRESYIPLQVTEALTGRQVTVYNQDPATLGKFDVVWSNRPEFDESFHGVDLTVGKRMSNRWMLMGTLSFAKSESNIHYAYARANVARLNLNDPNLAFPRGPYSLEVPVSFKMSGVYVLPYGFSVGANGEYYQGWPETTTVLVTRATVPLTQVNQSVVVEPAGTRRRPSVTMVNLNLGKTLRLKRDGATVEPRIDIFNLFNAAAITDRVTQLGPAYGNALEILAARLVKFGVNVSF